MHELRHISRRDDVGFTIELVSYASVVVFDLHKRLSISRDEVEMGTHPSLFRVSERIVSLL